MYYNRRYIFIFQRLNLPRAKGFEAYFVRTFAQRSIFVSILKIKGFGFLKEQKEKIVLYRAISIAGPSIVCSFGPISIVCFLVQSLLFVHWVKYLLFVSWFNLYCLFLGSISIVCSLGQISIVCSLGQISIVCSMGKFSNA